MSILDNTDWIEKLKAGDTVAVRSYNFGKYHHEFYKVAKLTPTQVVVLINPDNGTVSRFHRKNGDQVGRDIWHSCEIVEATPELLERINQAKHRGEIVKALEDFNFSSLPTSELDRIYSIISSIEKPLTK
jgi:hypothetical protein